jgi:hypothetical protein
MPDASSILAAAIGLTLGGLIMVVAAYLRRKSQTGVRPAGLALIAVFQLAFGTILFAGLLFMVAAAIDDLDKLRADFKRFGGKPEDMMARLMATSGMSLLAGWGLWRGTSWGWRFAMFAIANGIARNLLSLVLDRTNLAQQGASFFYTQHLTRASFNLVMLTYLYRPVVFEHCHLSLRRAAHAGSLAALVTLSFIVEIGLRLVTR